MFDGDPGVETDLDAIAATQEAQEAEREQIDAAASLEAAQGALRSAGQKPPQAKDLGPTDPHAEERAALGFDLSWWAEEQNSPPLDIVVGLANDACGRTHYLHDLEQHGFDLSETTSYVGLDAVSGPLVVTALMILGTLHSHVRDDVTKVLKQLWVALPEMAEAQTETFEKAEEALMTERMQQFAEGLGLQVVREDDFTNADEHAEVERPEPFDASNN